MHTVRTQLDHFQRVIPQIGDMFTVYAVDFPAMGWSTSSRAPATRNGLRAAVVRVVDELDLSDLTLAGESLAATLALTASVDLGERVRRVVGFNYDYADQYLDELARVGRRRIQSCCPRRANDTRASACP
jgi:pimeloyl-ACP methyl ester carboxylesterase